MTAPPTEWFNDPGLNGPTAVTVTDDGRVFGHIAEFGVQHVGYDEPTNAPRSASGYRYFRTGAVLTADGSQIATGRLTVGTGHAGMDAGVTAAAEHYDNTGTAVADVAVGEDEYGIWCAGSVRPGASDEQVHALRASPMSGDWRMIDGRYELVAALAVNVPGFPVPRLAMSAAGVPLALVAAGALVAAVDNQANPTKPAAKAAAKPAAKAAPAPAKPAPRKRAARKKKQPAQGGDFNSKHPRGASGGPTGGQFVPLGAARDSKAADAQKDPKAHAAYDALLKAPQTERVKQLAGMKDADLESLSRTAYSFKSSDPAVVALRIGIANQLAKRGKNVRDFGALGGGPARKPAAPAPKPPPPKAPPKPVARKPAVRAAATPTSREDNTLTTFTDDELVVMRSKLGLAEDAPGALIASAVAALDEPGEEEIEEEETEEEKPTSVQLPEGLVAVDAKLLEELKAKAARGDQARAKQEQDERLALVSSAVREGRIAPARRDHWIAQLEADPGVSTVLASLAPVIPVGSEIGHSSDTGGDPQADDLYAAVFGKDA